MSRRKNDKLETRVVHAGPRSHAAGAVVSPIYQSSVFEIHGEADYADLKYPRYGNLPDQLALAAKLAEIEGAEAAVVTASGMAAISSALLTVVRQGDHLLAADCLYGGTHAVVTRLLPSLGVEVDLVPGDDPEAWRSALRPQTKALYLETISNPLMEVPALTEAGPFGAEHALTVLIDNTFATPLGFRPAEHGIHLSLHSCTKYLGGHSDLAAGAVTGPRKLIERVLGTVRLLGGALDPHAVFLLHRGVKTLALRMARQNENAMRLAEFLVAHPGVERVAYPGLAQSASHRRAAAALDGFGGMLAFEPVGGLAAADRFLSAVELATHAPSLGGVETLVVSPARSSHRGLSPDERAAAGIRDGLVRVSVGVEAIEDLIDDFKRALGRAAES